MPSIAVYDFDYAALFYKDGASPENPPSKDFVEGTAGENGKLIFSFQRPDDTSGTFTLEVFAFVKTEGTADEETPQFSRENALLSGKKEKLTIAGDEIKINEAIPLSSDKRGTVSLKIKVPDGCSLEIDDTTNFAVTGTSPNFTLTQNGDGILAGAYQVKFTVKKKVGENEEIIHIFSEYINVINGLCTDTWNGLAKGAAKEITQGMISSTVYVRGTGGWYDTTSPYDDGTTATASDANSGSFLSPFATIQKAIDKIIAINDGTSEYTILVDGKLACDDSTYIGANGMADFSALGKDLNLTIKALSGTATLDGGARFDFDEDGKVIVDKEGIKKCIIYAIPASGTLNLTLENLVITGGYRSGNGGGVYFKSAGGRLTMTGCTVSGNTANDGGGVFISSTSTFTMNGGTITGNAADTAGGGVYNEGTFNLKGGTITGNTVSKRGGGVYVASNGKFEMTGGTISYNMSDAYGGGVYTMAGLNLSGGGTISNNTANYGGGVYVNRNTFTMSGNSTISNNEATGNGGGVFVNAAIDENTNDKCEAKFEMSGGAISGNTASNCGGGMYVLSETKNGVTAIGTFNMSGGTISGGSAKYGSGVYVYNGAFTMSGGEITGNKASYAGGGVYIYSSGTFTMSGGTISGNTRTVYAGGVYVNGGTFTMSDSASIPAGDNGKNDVYLTSGGTITVAGTLTATTLVATITPATYTANRQVLSAGDGVTLSGSICNKFAVKPQSDGTEWRVALDGASGVLIRKYAVGDTGPGEGAVCYYNADGFTVNGKTCHYLECSKETIGSSPWCPCTSTSGYCNVTTSTDIGAGYANTQAILAHSNHASATAANCAAKLCAEYSTSTTTAGEWFLPTLNEATRIRDGVAITSSVTLWISRGNSSNWSYASSVTVKSIGNSSGSDEKKTVLPVWAMRAF